MNQVRSTGLGFVVMATAVTAIGGFLFGYDTAVINGAISYLKADMGLDAAQEGMAGASAILGCIPGAMCAGFLSDRFGRKKMLFLCAAPRSSRSPAFSPLYPGSSNSSPRGF